MSLPDSVSKHDFTKLCLSEAQALRVSERRVYMLL